MSNKPKLSRRQRLEKHNETTTEAMKQYNKWQLAGLFFMGLVMLPWLLGKKLFRR